MFDIRNKLDNVKSALRDFRYNKRCRERLTNSEFTIISQNCMGGILYHRYNMQFKSPTINLFINPSDFIVFCENLHTYLTEGRLCFIECEKSYPVAKLKCQNLKDILVYFMHYESIEEAEKKWYERSRRVNFNNIFFITSDLNLTYDEIQRFDRIQCSNKVVFTAREYSDIKSAFFLEKYKNEKYVGKFVNDINKSTGVRYVEEVFDFVAFFNCER
jgi:uncharacterized protein (DUF1919 family)